ncbi:VWA domain-containing protein [Planctomicrobium sp. SH661]|uniref:VWA domain-containing protein n=1 Tax=Planctomicrobium sp. SH661 TaxID=3448124 RepID=UPI003F5B6EFD
MSESKPDDRLRRWRLVLGSEPRPQSASTEGLDVELEGEDQQIDQVLRALYDSDRKAGLGSSSPKVNRWLGDIRRFFPASVVRMMQKDALERLKLHEMLLQPETLETVEADVQLVGTLLTLKNVIPEKTRETARMVVRKVVRDVEKRLRQQLTSAVRGALDRVTRSQRPRPQEIDWNRTIRKNLKHYLPEFKTLIPERLVGHGRRQGALRDVVLCVDQSGSMATSVVYAGIFGAVLASLKSLRTQMIVFDTEVVDLTEHLQDPVDLLFAAQLGGGTDINRAISYCHRRIQRPAQTTLILISDLFEGGEQDQLIRRIAQLTISGVTVICLLALNDEGTPSYNQNLAMELSSLAVPSFACTPDLFPELMAAALRKQDLSQWAARHDVVVRGTATHVDMTVSEESSNMLQSEI